VAVHETPVRAVAQLRGSSIPFFDGVLSGYDYIMTFRGADLHCHSTFSDGVETPTQLVARAQEAGLSVLALSDHDALHGLPEFEAAAKGTGLVTVAATELSTRCDGDDVHVLGLFVDPEEPALAARLAAFRADRDRRGEAIVEKLASIGMPLDLAEIRAVVGEGAFGRPHIARAMLAKGFVKSFNEAFDEYLIGGKPAYVAKAKWSLQEAIASIHGAGGLAVIAHPVWYRDPEKIVVIGLGAGLDGLEVFHIDQDGKEDEFEKLAERHGLLTSGGSDYHGPPEGRKRVGACRLDEENWSRVVAAAAKRRVAAGRGPVDLSPR
jgi:predicted metal-dependent phosphoesterase TrpH